MKHGLIGMNTNHGHWVTNVFILKSKKWIEYYFVSSTVMADWFGSVNGFIQCRDKLLGDGGEYGIPDLLAEIADEEHEGCNREGPIRVKNEEYAKGLVPGYFLGKLGSRLVK